MNKKLLLLGLGVILVVGSFFVGVKYKETPKDNTKNDVVKEEPVFNLNSLLNEVSRYSVGEGRTIFPLKNLKQEISLAFVYEVKDVSDQEKFLGYRIYRVGAGDYPPTYSAERIFLQVAESHKPGTPLTLYDTGIDELGLGPLGKTYIRGGKLVITCSNKNPNVKNLCEYEIDFSEDNYNLVVNRKI